MINSIQHFLSEWGKNFEKIMVDYSSDITKIAEMVREVTKEMIAVIFAERYNKVSDYKLDKQTRSKLAEGDCFRDI